MADEQKILAQIPPFFYYYEDGSVQRFPPGPLLPPSPQPGPDGVASRDLTLNPDLGLWVRLFLPPSPSPHPSLQPLVLYFHGGGFLFGGPHWNHSFCADMAKRSGSIWVSASYRLAPEHRLPAALDDAFAALQWLHSQALLQAEGKHELMDAWLVRADFSKCFIAGESAGGSLAHHVAMRAMNNPEFSSSGAPLCIHGLILIHPGFVRENRTQEEMNCHQDVMMNWSLADTCQRLAAPPGADMDHPFFNPLSDLKAMDKYVLPKTLVALADNDALHFMGLEYIQALKDAGCSVNMIMSHGVGHVFFILQRESEETQKLFQKIANFITEDC